MAVLALRLLPGGIANALPALFSLGPPSAPEAAPRSLLYALRELSRGEKISTKIPTLAVGETLDGR